jgi:hypothetical protein
MASRAINTRARTHKLTVNCKCLAECLLHVHDLIKLAISVYHDLMNEQTLVESIDGLFNWLYCISPYIARLMGLLQLFLIL